LRCAQPPTTLTYPSLNDRNITAACIYVQRNNLHLKKPHVYVQRINLHLNLQTLNQAGLEAKPEPSNHGQQPAQPPKIDVHPCVQTYWTYLNLKLSTSRESRMIGCGDHFRCKFSFPLFAPSRLKLSLYSSSSKTFVKVRMHRPM